MTHFEPTLSGDDVLVEIKETLTDVTPHRGQPLRLALAWSAALAGLGVLGLCMVLTTAVEPASLRPTLVSAAPVPQSAPALPAVEPLGARAANVEIEARVDAVRAPGHALAAPVAPRPAGAATPVIAIVVDDVGLDPHATRRVLDLPAPVTASVLPYAPGLQKITAQLAAAGHEVFVHLPMEPAGLADPGPFALTTWHDPQIIRARAAAAFDAAPHALGFNNHMGSRFTACAACLAPVLDVAAARNMVVLDSLTDSRSQLAVAARQAGLTALARDVFLDHDRDTAAMDRALAQAEAIARQRGYAVIIAHPHDASFDALERWLPRAQAAGFAIGGAAALAQHLSTAQRSA